MQETHPSTSKSYILHLSAYVSFPKTSISALGESNKFSHYQNMILYFLLQYKCRYPNKIK